MEGLVAFVAGFGGGMANSIAGGGTNLTFPTLLWLGVSPVLASSTSTFALWLGQALGAWAYREETAAAPRRWLWFCLPAACGGLLGGWLLVHTPVQTFRSLVPWLVLGGSAALAAEPWLRQRLKLQEHHHALVLWQAGAAVAIFLVSIYGGYFGAGMGILMLVTLGLLGVGTLQRANGLKNLFGAVMNLAAILYFLAVGALVWFAAVSMVSGAALGGYLGARLAGRIPEGILRWLMVAIGLGVGLILLF